MLFASTCSIMLYRILFASPNVQNHSSNNYIMFPVVHARVFLSNCAEPTYQEITPKVKVTAPARRRSKSGGATRNVIFVDNPLYEHSQSLPPPRKENVEKNMFV